jgi:hypothetical protein
MRKEVQKLLAEIAVRPLCKEDHNELLKGLGVIPKVYTENLNIDIFRNLLGIFRNDNNMFISKELVVEGYEWAVKVAVNNKKYEVKK